MRTVSTVVEDIIAHSPFLSEVLVEDVANHSKIARRIKPQVEKRLLEEVSEPTIAMALRRLAGRLPKSSFGVRFLRHLSDMTVRSNLVEFIFASSKDIPSLHQKMLEIMPDDKDFFLHVSNGLHEATVVASVDLEKDIEIILKEQKEIRKIKYLSSITLRLPKESVHVPGVYYPLLKALAWDGINLEEILSSSTELTILFNTKDIDKAFTTLKRITEPEATEGLL